MKAKLLIILSAISIFFGLLSCKPDADYISPDTGSDFYPNQTGYYIIYDVDSTYYDDFTHTVSRDTFQIKEIIESQFTDQQNRDARRIERWYKWSDTTDWILKDVWYSVKTLFRVERIEENERFIRLVFPVSDYTTWDGNAMNDIGYQKYEFDNVYDPYTVNNINFDSTCKVKQAASSNLIDEKLQYEIYAKKIGLIYKRYKVLKKDYVTSQIISGIDYTWKINSYGFNN